MASAENTPANQAETPALQRRLSDARCHHGAIAGAPTAALDAAVKQCPDMKPFLRIETGMHTAPIWRFGVDAACSLMATPSDDKTVRLWSLPEGRLERTIRLPIGDGNEGKVYAAALTPDGRTLAAGGWDASYAKTKTPCPDALRTPRGARGVKSARRRASDTWTSRLRLPLL